ncbi:hypothetical protein PCANC_25857 [Puccinia coronata f. sp. avenae]|uniref:Uncharacterized protein n=1 Tax=Puccinia coronata f. sp. avenae TaxID=200324 RepID=A0A2N5TM73_9BASI|nr:hypothetical protein PCANC_25857 [Puccinia coronata f. sp. avenae]
MFFISYNQKVSCVGQKERYGVNSSKHQEYEVPNHTKRRSQVYNLSGPPLDIPHTSIQECPYVSWTPSRRLLPHRLVRPKRIKNSVHSKVDFIDDIKRGEQEVRRTLSLYLFHPDSAVQVAEGRLVSDPPSSISNSQTGSENSSWLVSSLAGFPSSSTNLSLWPISFFYICVIAHLPSLNKYTVDTPNPHHTHPSTFHSSILRNSKPLHISSCHYPRCSWHR